MLVILFFYTVVLIWILLFHSWKEYIYICIYSFWYRWTLSFLLTKNLDMYRKIRKLYYFTQKTAKTWVPQAPFFLLVSPVALWGFTSTSEEAFRPAPHATTTDSRQVWGVDTYAHPYGKTLQSISCVGFIGTIFFFHRDLYMGYYKPSWFQKKSPIVETPRPQNKQGTILLILSWESKGTPPMPPPPRNKALLRDYYITIGFL